MRRVYQRGGRVGGHRSGRSYGDEKELMNRIETGRKTSGGTGLPPWIDPAKAELLIKNGWFNPQIPQGEKDFTFMFDVIPSKAGYYDSLSARGRRTHTCQCYIHESIGPLKNRSFLCRDIHVNKVLLKEDAAACREVTWGSEKEDEGCEVCRERDDMRSKGADYEDLKPYFSKKRNLYNIRPLISRAEMEIVKPWNISFHYIEKLLMKNARETFRPDEDELNPFINFASTTKDGKSIKVTLGTKIVPPENKGDKPRSFPTYDALSFKDRRKPIESHIKKQVICLDDLLLIPSAEEVYEAFHAKAPSRREGERRGERQDDSWESNFLDDFSDMDDLEDELSEMTKREMIKFILDYKLPIDIDDVKDEDRDEVLDEIIGECEDLFGNGDISTANKFPSDNESSNGAEGEDNSCPYGHRFGTDVNEEDECEKCPPTTWNACLRESQ